MKSKIELWGWEKKPRTMLRYIKVGDIVCFEIDKTGTKFGYGQIIAHLPPFVFKAFDLVCENPNDITIEDLKNAKQLGEIFVFDAHLTLDKKYTENGEWRIIGRENDFQISDDDLKKTFFVQGCKNIYQKIDLHGEQASISNEEAENYLPLSPTAGDSAKVWYIKYK